MPAKLDFPKAVNGAKKFNDTEFLLSDKVKNYGNDTADQIFEVNLHDKANGRHFIDDIEASDIAQGEAGDCWFLSSLCSFANLIDRDWDMNHETWPDDAPDLLQNIVQVRRTDDNGNKLDSNEDSAEKGCFVYQFYRMGDWNKVIIDDKLPLKIYEKKLSNGKIRRGGTFEPDEVGDYWALLLEKAFAKFVGGYMQLEGGFPRCAVTYLSGGITTTDDIELDTICETMKQENVFDYLESIEDDALIVVSNHDNDEGEEDHGLIAGHAYSVEDFETLKNGQKILQLRNPWGEGEWTGEYGDKWLEDNRASIEKIADAEQLDKLYPDGAPKPQNPNDSGSSEEEEQDDGKFWMKWEHFLEEFESLTVCHLNNDNAETEHRANGTFTYGPNGNSAQNKDEMATDYLNPAKHFQIRLKVTKPGLIKFQLLLDLPMKPRKDKVGSEQDHKLIFMAVHRVDSEWPENETATKLQLYEADLFQPRLPIIRPENEFKGYRFENYDFNGWVYDFTEGEYVIVVASCPNRNSDSTGHVPDCDFLFRARNQVPKNQEAAQGAKVAEFSLYTV